MFAQDPDGDGAFLRGGGATAALIAGLDWRSVSLGAPSRWPNHLRNATALILTASVPMAILYGEDGATIYNDSYSGLLGSRHPAALGSVAREAFLAPALVDDVIFAGLAGRTSAFRDLEVTTDRSGSPETVWLDVDCSPLLGEGGLPTGVLSIFAETTARVLAERRAGVEVVELRRSRQRLSAAMAVARLGTIEWNPRMGEPNLDARAREIFGFTQSEHVGFSDLLGRLEPEEAARLTARARAAFAAGQSRREYEYQIHLPGGGVRTVVTVSDRLTGDVGETQGVIAVVIDVTERRRAERRQQLLINELNHRVKNTLATVQSLSMQTLRAEADPARARRALEARLTALAAAHDVLTEQSWRGAELGDIVNSAMAPFAASNGSRLDHSGPPVWLTAQRALALTMALHELATNAANYGALSCPEGRVSIRWRMDEGGVLDLSWVEAGGPAVVPPLRTGFGARLLQRGLVHEIGGEVALCFSPEGVRCNIRCKLDLAPTAAEFDIGPG